MGHAFTLSWCYYLGKARYQRWFFMPDHYIMWVYHSFDQFFSFLLGWQAEVHHFCIWFQLDKIRSCAVTEQVLLRLKFPIRLSHTDLEPWGLLTFTSCSPWSIESQSSFSSWGTLFKTELRFPLLALTEQVFSFYHSIL